MDYFNGRQIACRHSSVQRDEARLEILTLVVPGVDVGPLSHQDCRQHLVGVGGGHVEGGGAVIPEEKQVSNFQKTSFVP